MSRVWRGYLILRALLVTALFSGPAAHAASQEERDALIAVHMLGTKEAYQRFLEKYPASEFAKEVLDILTSTFAAPVVPPPVVPPLVAPPATPVLPHKVSTEPQEPQY